MNRITDVQEDFSVIDALTDVADTVRKRYPGCVIEIEDEDAVISGYRALFDEMILNLLTNAFKHGAKSVKIRVSVNSVNNAVIIRVEDDGPGISDDMKQRIFEPFSRSGRGVAGLGLSIVKRVAELHGGKVMVEDNHPRGTAFVVEIPVK
jgi:signal transduction histidine kinase